MSLISSLSHFKQRLEEDVKKADWIRNLPVLWLKIRHIAGEFHQLHAGYTMGGNGVRFDSATVTKDEAENIHQELAHHAVNAGYEVRRGVAPEGEEEAAPAASSPPPIPAGALSELDMIRLLEARGYKIEEAD